LRAPLIHGHILSLFKISPYTECTVTRRIENNHPDIAISSDLLTRLRDLLGHSGVDRVHRVGAVESQNRKVISGLQLDGIRHDCTPDD
jgi:hypothetical protein